MSSAELASATPLADALRETRQVRVHVEQLISTPSLLGPEFSVIRRIDDHSVPPDRGACLGWRAAPRGRPGTAAGDTLHLLAEARRLGLVERYDWAFRCHVFDVAARQGIDGELHLVVEPETFTSPCPPRLAVSFLRGRRTLAVVAELHADAFRVEATLLAAVEQMRGWGWQFAIGDLTGTPAERSAISLMTRIRPAYQLLDLTGSPSPALVESALGAGASALAVGVDQPEDLARARAQGAEWARGNLVGLPATRPS